MIKHSSLVRMLEKTSINIDKGTRLSDRGTKNISILNMLFIDLESTVSINICRSTAKKLLKELEKHVGKK